MVLNVQKEKMIEQLGQLINGLFKMGIAIWWACEWSVNLWTTTRKHIPIIFHPCQLKYSLIDFDDMLKYTLTKIYSCHVSDNSHVITTTWICQVDTQQQCLCSIQHKYKNLPRLVPHVLKQKIYNLAPLLRIMPLGVKHVLCGRILFVSRSILYTTTSFEVVAMGDKLNIAITWTCQQNTNGQI
jgi:hypothetical protein